jgi:hypothetical protein
VNADASDSARIFVSARFFPQPAQAPGRSHRWIAGRFVFRVELHRASDGALMASSVVRKALAVPGVDKDAISEATRFRARLERRINAATLGR